MDSIGRIDWARAFRGGKRHPWAEQGMHTFNYDDRPVPGGTYGGKHGAGYVEDDPLGIRQKYYYPRVCQVCGVRFYSLRPNTRNRSHRCQNDAYIERRRQRRKAAQQKVCPICGEPFTAKRSDAKTCSAACRQKMSRMWRSLK